MQAATMYCRLSFNQWRIHHEEVVYVYVDSFLILRWVDSWIVMGWIYFDQIWAIVIIQLYICFSHGTLEAVI